MARKTKKPVATISAVGTPPLYGRVRDILEAARGNIARTVNTTQVIANWLVGREIIEEEQNVKSRAGYAQQLVLQLSEALTAAYGKGWSAQSLFYMKQFYQSYPRLLPEVGILHATDGELPMASILHAMRGESFTTVRLSPAWQPGTLHSHLSWTHYRTLLRVKNTGASLTFQQMLEC
ncbi:MAG: hypothetical protein KJ558_03540 [Gammaproteobacteria bacterium]|nr:hypothetical protein [Gammaproteobacteria bacterium]MBU1653898.1 hypothetical protein [Gammaproteobacteria bacterium]MBU1960383.1 hypothetical protein [Gammaproteobacteria bacterium]